MGGTATSTAIASVIAVIITGMVTLATQRAAAKASIRNQDTQSRTELERDAFERAKAFYTGVIDRQDQEIRDCHDENQALQARVNELRSRVDALERELGTAQKALRLIHRDEG